MTSPKRIVLSHINRRWHVSALQPDDTVVVIGVFNTEGEARAHVDANYPGVTILRGGSTYRLSRYSKRVQSEHSD